MKKILKRGNNGLEALFHIEDGVRVEGRNENLKGNCSDLKGDCSGLEGGLDDAEVTQAERKIGVELIELEDPGTLICY